MISLKTEFSPMFFQEEGFELKVSARKKEVWAVELDLLMQLDQVCKANGLKYFLAYGSVLGAIRHGGIIPWDDDIDVGMLRHDYDKLCQIADCSFQSPYFFQTNATDPASATGHAQLRNSLTTAILKKNLRGGKSINRANQGIFIDIFVFDNVPDDENVEKDWLRQLKILKRRTWAERERQQMFSLVRDRRFSLCRKSEMISCLPKSLLEMTLGTNYLVRACSALDSLAKKYSACDTKYVAPVTFSPAYQRPVRKLPRKIFEDLECVSFNGFKIPIPRLYEEMLRAGYGDWREHVIGTAVHGGVLFDADRSYLEYVWR